MIVIYDLETLKDFFLYVDIELNTNKFNIFEISRFQNDCKSLLRYLKNLQGQIGFNNLGFDAQILHWIDKNQKDLYEDGDIAASQISYYANYVISKSNNNEWLDFNERDFKIKQVDLYKVWHFNNKAKMTSLKWIQYMTDWSPIEDMPVDHNKSITDRSEADKIISYCKNDCLSTKRLYEITRGTTEHILYKGIDRLQLRKDIRKEFGFDCTNFDDVKIGDEINKQGYLKATGLNKYDLKNQRSELKPFTFKDCFPEYIHFETEQMNVFIDSIKDIQIIVGSQDQKFSFEFQGARYTLAKGGLHSEDPSRVIIPSKDEILRDADIGSQYPNSIRKREIYPSHRGKEWLISYEDVIRRRLDAKNKFKETKDLKYQSIQEAFKLSLNGGGYGKLGEKTNWQYDPFSGAKVTIGNQIEILMLIETLQLGGIKVVSANTDGIVCLFGKHKESVYNQICEDWEKKVGNSELGKLEYCDYQLLAQRSVNDYIAIKTDGKPKHKGGTFTIHHELHKNKSNRVIALALDAFYQKGLNPRTFILSHDNIFDFCSGIRTKGEWYLEARGIVNGTIGKERLQKTNRYYISNKGVKLIKCNPDGREIQEDAGKWLATIYNKHIQKDIKDYDINYEFYIKQVYDVLSEIQPEILNENYTQLDLF